MTVFNSLQITALFSASPFLIGWLFNTEFPGAMAARWLSVAVYIAYFTIMAGCVGRAIQEGS